MKIYYLVASSEGKFPNIKFWYTKADNYIEANKIQKGVIDKKTDDLIKVFEKNKEFENNIIKTRKLLGIPANGYSLKE